MNAIEFLNRAAALWAEWVWGASIASGVVLVGIVLLWLAVRRRVSAHVGYGLFLLPLLPLAVPALDVLPRGVESPVQVAPLHVVFPAVVADGPAPTTRPATSPVDASAPTTAAGASSPPDFGPPRHVVEAAPPVRPSLAAWLFLGWLATVGILLARFVAVQVATHRMVRRAASITDGDLARPLRWHLAEAGLRRPVRIAVSADVDSPAVWGILRPTLVLPVDLLAHLGETELAWVLHHEFAHLRRGDLAVAAAQRIVQILWFFQPVAWVANRVVEELRECACDEAALARCVDGSRRRCAEALVRVAELASRGRRPVLALQTFHAPKAILERRIMRNIDTRRPLRRGLTAASLPVLLLGVGLSLASAQLAVRGAEPIVQDAQGEGAGPVGLPGPVASPGGGTSGPRGVPGPSGTPGPRSDDAAASDPAVDEAGRARAVARGLDWLVAQQAKEGNWFAGVDASVPISGEFNAVGVTGLVLLNLLEAGKSGAPGAHSGALARGLAWLASVQDKDTGLFGSDDQFLYVPSHAVATLAWMRAHEGATDEGWKPVAEKAVQFLLRARNPYAAWRYDCPPVGDNDSFVTSLALLALDAARDVGLAVDQQAIAGGMSFLDRVTKMETGRTGYDKPGSPVSRLAVKADAFPAEYSEMLTAMAINVRMEWGEDPGTSKAIPTGALLVMKQAPLWDKYRGSIDYYHWLFGTMALRPLGGFQWDHWRAFLLRSLLPHQQAEGWWPAVDAWSSEGSVVHATALNVLSLQLAR